MNKFLLLLVEDDQKINLSNVKILWKGKNGFEMIGNPNQTWKQVYLIKTNEEGYKRLIDEHENATNVQLFRVSPASRLKRSIVKFLMNYVFRMFPMKLDRIPMDEIWDKLDSPITPNAKSVKRLIDNDDNKPIIMLNLLRYKENANYKNGENVSGEVAYNRYSTHAIKAVSKIGGQLEHLGKVEETLIGGEKWQDYAFMRYNSHDRFINMITLKENKDAAIHREAGLDIQLLVALKHK